MAYFDVLVNLQRNPVFRRRIEQLTSAITAAERDPEVGPRSVAVAEIILDIYRSCGYNAGILLPYFFPRCDFLKGNALSLSRRPFAYCFYHMGIGFVLCIKGSRQIAKTTSLICRQKLNTHLLPGYKVIHIVPHLQHLQTYGTKFREMERAFLFHDSETKDPKFRNNLYLKEYPNASSIQMFRVSTSADHVRSATSTEINYDEYQLFDTYFEEDINQTAKTSDFKNRIYTGTSTTTDTPLEARFQEGSGGVWHVLANDDKTWLNMSEQKDLWSIMHPEGPRCPVRGTPLDMSRGEFVHAFPDRLLDNKPSFHIPQVIIPDYVTDPIAWKIDIYDKWKRDQHNPKKILQELFGIATEEGSKELTEQHLKDICCLPDSPETLKNKAKAGKTYRYIVSGCDWGGSDYNQALKTKLSFTVHVILGVHHTGECDILHMRKYAGMEYEDIVEKIVANHNAYGGTAIASDYGGGQGYNNMLRKHPKMNPMKCIVFFYTAPVTAPVAKSKNDYVNMYSLNRTESITELILSIKRTPPRIRCYNWEEAQNELMDFLNVYRIPAERDHGTPTFLYRKHGAKADDTLHATNFAFSLARMMLNEPLVEDPTVKARLFELFGDGAARASFNVMPTPPPGLLNASAL